MPIALRHRSICGSVLRSNPGSRAGCSSLRFPFQSFSDTTMKTFFPSVSVARAFVLLLCVCTVFIFNSCSEVTQPEDTVRATFTVQTELRHEVIGGQLSTQPLPNVRVTLQRLSSMLATGSGTTDNRGQAVLTDEVPVSGDDFVVEAYSPDYGTRIDTVHGVCGDANVRFTFRDITAIDINCNTPNTAAALFLFTDNVTGSEKLIRNAPNPVRNCLPVARNTGRDVLDLSIPTGPIGVFTITAIQIDGQMIPVSGNPMRVSLGPNSILSLCCDVRTSAVSTGQPNDRFEESLRIGVQCPSGSFELPVNLRATIEEETCDCDRTIPASDLTFELAEPVRAGTTDTLTAAVLTNTAPCTITVRVKSITPTAGRNNDWRIIAPSALQNTGGEIRLEKGQALSLTAVFSPATATTVSTPSQLELELEVIPDGNPTPCAFTVSLTGESCDEACPALQLNGRNYPFGTNPPPRDSLYIRTDKRVFISDEELSFVRESYDFILTSGNSLVCELNDVILRMEPVGDIFPSQYYSISNTRVSLRTNGAIAGSFDVTFTAPTKQELDNILRQRNPGGPPKTADSMFTMRIIMTVAGCPQQELFVDAIVTTLPDFTPPIKLHAYRQTTSRQPKPEYEYYLFGESFVRSFRNDNNPPANGPETGDLWVDVPNPNGPLPQQPFIKNESGLSWAYWQTITDESFFNNILQIVQQVENGVKNNTFTFNTGDIRSTPPGNLAVGSVYIFRFSPTRYAVMVIREINNGTENNLNNQSAIHFRALSPVLISN